MPRLRPAEPGDASAINDIYNYYVLNSDSTLQLEPTSLEERRAWLASLEALGVWVAHEDGPLLAWGALMPFQPRAGYRFTLEHSVYVRVDAHRRGLGRALL